MTDEVNLKLSQLEDLKTKYLNLKLIQISFCMDWWKTKNIGQKRISKFNKISKFYPRKIINVKAPSI